MPSSLPSFSRGLKLIRFAVFVMLLQLAAVIVVTVRALGANDAQSVRTFIEWTKYSMLVHIAATSTMLVGVIRSIPELARARIPVGRLAVAASGFVLATAMVLWTYSAFSGFIDVILDPEATAERMMAAGERLEWAKYAAILKDVSYAVGLICVLRTVQQSAAVNDQLALRDEAGSMSRAVIVMLIADLFWQLTYGLGGPAAVFGLLGSLLVGVYWIYCHVRLARFLYNAAYFVNEPHNLPVATVVVREDKPEEAPQPPPRPAPAARPARPAVVAASPAPPPPRPPSQTPAARDEAPSDDGGPRFLR